MKSEELLKIFKSKNIVIPLYLYKLIDKFDIDLDSFVVLMYFYNEGLNILFNPEQITEELGLDSIKLMEHVSKLIDKKLISLNVIKNDKGVMEEYINLELFYQRLMFILMDENNRITIDGNIFEKIEREFARPLSPMEYELVKAWLENNTSEEIIEEALKEASLNGVSNLRYMDKIIYAWSKKGFKTKEDVEKNRLEFKNNKSKEKVEVFEYNWLDDDDD